MRHQPLNPTAQPFVPPAPLPTLIPTARDQGPSPAACSLPQSSLAASTSRPKRISPLPPKPLLCKFFNAEGGCPSGQTCLFVHEAPNSVGPPNVGANQRRKKQLKLEKEAEAKERTDRKGKGRASSTGQEGSEGDQKDGVSGEVGHRNRITCKFWVEGYCHRSSSCAYCHTLNTLPGPTLDLSDARTHDIVLVSEATPVPLLEVGEPLFCSICFEEPPDFGLLEGCSHCFCVPCIKEWRKKKEADVDAAREGASKNKTCPLCRRLSHFVTPSSKFYAAGPEKDEVIKKYKDHMNLVPCRYFTETESQWCPYGDSCFYSHRADPFSESTLFHRTVASSLPAHKRRARLSQPPARPEGIDLSHMPSRFLSGMEPDILGALLNGLLRIDDLRTSMLSPPPANANADTDLDANPDDPGSPPDDLYRNGFPAA